MSLATHDAEDDDVVQSGQGAESSAIHVTETKWWDDLMHGVFGPRKGGARIIVDGENAATGVAKTTAAIAIGQLCARAFGYEMQEEDITLSGRKYLERWREHPDKEQPSVIILDELSGAGAGDARKAMAGQNVNLGRSWQLMRKKRIVTITTLPHWRDADSRMRRFADFRLWCREQPIGYFKPFKVGAAFDDGSPVTYGYRDVNNIGFPNLDKRGSELYHYAAQLKDGLLESEVYDADELTEEAQEENRDPDEVERDTKLSIAQSMRDNGKSQTEIAADLGMSQAWVSKYTDPPEDSE
jgi:hypothetical protein